MWCWRRHLRVPWTARRSNQSILKEINPEYSWKDWCWSLSSSTLATLCKEPTHWKNPDAGKDWGQKEKVGDRRWDGWMASPTQWTWLWANSGRWWRTRKPGMLQCVGSQRVKHDLATEQQSITYIVYTSCPCLHMACWLLTICELNKLSSCLQTI